MAKTLRFSANINTFNACADRYVLSGYGERLTTDQPIRAATQVEGLTGVDMVGFGMSTTPMPKLSGNRSAMPAWR